MKLLLDEPARPIDVLRKWLLRAGVALLFIFIGSGKFAVHSQWVRIFDQIGFGQWFRYFTGVLQVAGGLLVLIPRTFVLGIIILSCTMTGAMASWVFLLGAPFNAMIPGILLGVLVFVGGEDLVDVISLHRRRWLHNR